MRRYRPSGQRNPVVKFIRSQVNSENSLVLTGSKLIDDNFILNKGEVLLIRSKPYSGSSALCFEFASWFTNTSGMCFYCDCNDAVITTRIEDFDLDNFIHVRPNSTFQLLEVIWELREILNDGLIIIDQASLLASPEKDSSFTISNLISKIREYCPQATIIATDGAKHWTSDIWNKVCMLKNTSNYYHQRQWIGHFITIFSKNTQAKHFISYRNGRLSRVYEHMTLEVLNGKQNSAVFEWEGKQYKGFWNTLNQVEG